MDNLYDVIICGSGIGGLSAAAVLSNQGMSILVIEKQNKIGGYAQSFSRKGFTFTPTLHHWGDMVVESYNKVLEYLNQQPIQYYRFSEKFSFPEHQLPARFNSDYRNNLLQYFPEEAEQIDNIFSVLEGIPLEIEKILTAQINNTKLLLTPQKFPLIYKLRKATYVDLLQNIKNKQLRAILLPVINCYNPDDLFISTATMHFHFQKYLHYYADGGSDALVNRLADIIHIKKQSIITNTEVLKIKQSTDKVFTVETNNGYYKARNIVINTDGPSSFLKILDDKLVNPQVREKINTSWKPTSSFFAVYLGLDYDIRNTVNCRENIHHFESYGGIELSRNLAEGIIPDKIWSWVGFSPNLDRKNIPEGCSIVVAGLPMGYKPFQNLVRKSAEYKQLKNIITELVIDIVEKYLPDVRKHIIVKESATPLTYQRYSSNTNGAYHGWDKTFAYFNSSLKPGNEDKNIPGLYYVGGWYNIIGIINIAIHGVKVANSILTKDNQTGIPIDTYLQEISETKIQ